MKTPWGKQKYDWKTVETTNSNRLQLKDDTSWMTQKTMIKGCMRKL